MTTKSGGVVTIPSMDPAMQFDLTAQQLQAAARTVSRHARDDADRALLLDMCGLTSADDNAPGGTND